MGERSCDILIVGGGTGGCAAALAASQYGYKVIMTEQYPWIGGQLTSQAVPPDEHPWIETCGCTATYREYRNRVRRYYRDYYPLTYAARSDNFLNPGSGWVSKLCHEPRVGHAVLGGMMMPSIAAGWLEVLIPLRPISVDVDGDTIKSVTLLNMETGSSETILAKMVLDATELGDLLPLAGAEYVSGAESQKDTGEPHALPGDADPNCVQGLTWCFAMGFDPNGDHVIEEPQQYKRWRALVPEFWAGPILDWKTIQPQTGNPLTWTLFKYEHARNMGLFDYRQIVNNSLFEDNKRIDTTIVNWPQNDYFVENIIDQSQDVVDGRLADAKQLSLSLLYWLQTEAERPDGGHGYPGLCLQPSITGTSDGFAQAPYIRESRRIKAEFTILEQHVATGSNPERRTAEPFYDSVGIGSYRIDLHPCVGGYDTIDISSIPFEIPLGALVPVRLDNLIPACKNLGVTHITNGCYRLHPVEWNIGEAAGHLAAMSLSKAVLPRSVRATPAFLNDLQERLADTGVELHWQDYGPL
ncbi:MAG: FAD-dependent oxidoreductase [Fimbriimonadaceae bacterium]|nr:FAD-dependent oxidoreductase [Fimbriimonadaceae bacterium]